MKSTASAQVEGQADATEQTEEWVRLENTDVYRRKNGTYYERPNINGRFPYRSLGTKNKNHAVEEWKRREAIRRGGKDPQPKPSAATLGEVIGKYKTDNYPDKQRKPRPELMQKAEEANCETLLKYWRNIQVEDLTVAECDHYHDWRVKMITRGTGDRTVDLELNTLRNALLWSARCERIKMMPLPAGWPTYCSDKSVQHCREFMPAGADELHKIARFFFADPRSEVLGFQLLFEAYTGQRTIEVLQFRSDAPANEPGWLTTDNKSVCVNRAKGQDMVNPFAQVNDGLSQLLDAWKRWKQSRYPKSPWYFPGRDTNGSNHVDKGALGHALKRVRVKIGRKITPHGMRAFYVTVRRSHGIPDNQIAFEIGHTSGGKTLAEVYGGCPPHWLSEGGPKMTWLPDGEPAWAVLSLSEAPTPPRV